MVWISTKKSLSNKEVSLLAIIEVFIAVSIYWSIAIYFDTYIHLFIAIIIAPFLLLSSDISRKYNIEFLNSRKNLLKEDIRPEYRGHAMLMITIISILSVVVFVDLGVNFVVIIFLVSIFTASILFLFGKELENIGILSKMYVSMVIGLLFGFLIMGEWYGVISSIFLIMLIPILKESGFIFFSLLLLNPLTFGLGTVLILYIYAIYSIFKAKEPLSLISSNWKYNVLVKDFVNYPELILGVENSNVEILKFSNFVKRKNIILLPLFLFPIIYQISIKATAWFYVPLLILANTPKSMSDNVELKDFLSKLHRYSYVKFFFLISFLAVITFLLANLKLNFLLTWDSPFAMYMSIFYFDFSSIEVWKILQLLLPFLTIVLYFWSDYIWRKEENRELDFTRNKHVKYIFFTNNLRNIISFIYFLFLFLYMSYHFEIWNYEYIPDNVDGFLSSMVKVIKYRLL